MKNPMSKWIIMIIVVITACNQESTHFYSEPQEVIISGTILNPDSNIKKVDFYINNIGTSQEKVSSIIDSSGSFRVTFKCYNPTDLFLSYQTNFNILIHPGDRIYVEFDGSLKNREEVLKSISFSGDASIINQECAEFQQLFYSQRITHDVRNKKIKDLNQSQYIQFEDSLRQINKRLMDQLFSSKRLKEESKKWISDFLDSQYYYTVNWYPSSHGSYNKLSKEDQKVPVKYYEFLLERLPFSKADFICGEALSIYLSAYEGYVYKKTMDELTKHYGKSELEEISNNKMDSILVDGVIKYTPDKLLRQIVLFDFFSNRLKNSQAETVENFQDVIDEYIKEEFLYVQLDNKYKEVKERLENQKLAADAILKELNESSVKEIIDTILYQNKDKVVLIDCWATWCSPCLNEFPYSKDLMQSMKNKNVEFVFLCIDSPETAWKAKLSEFKLGGQHYFLNKKQSNELRESLKINGIPHYILIDKSGEISEQGSSLRPSNKNTIKKIETLLEKN